MKTYTNSQVNEFKLSEITDMSNSLAKLLGVKTTKRFASKAKAVEKFMALQAQYVEECQEADESFNTPVEKAPAEKVPAEKAKKSGNRGHYDLNSRFMVTDKGARLGTAMELIQDCVVSLCDGGDDSINGYAKAEDVIFEFKSRYVQVRGKAEVNDSFARGYLTGAIREGYVKIVNEEDVE